MELKTTCPRDCYDSCGMLVRVEDGRVTRVKGDPDHDVSRGALCSKCSAAYNSVWLDPQARVTQPLERVGAKGRGQFREITWDRALSIISDRLSAIIADGEAHTILHTHYTGTCSLLAGVLPSRFFDAIGATEVDPDTVCNNAGHVMLHLMLGDSVAGFDPRSAADAECLLLWGVNPSASAPHAHKHWIPEFGGTTIVVDPVRHATARLADVHLQPRPGTDTALAFGLLAAVRDAGRLDLAFLNDQCRGWSEVAAVLDGFSVEQLASRCEVAPEAIRRCADLVANHPTLMWLGQGLQRQQRGGEVFRACVVVAAATGNVVGPGRGILFLNGPAGRRLDLRPLVGRGGGGPKVSHMDLIDVLADPGRSRALVCWNNNIAASNPRQNGLRQSLRREDLFTVVLEVFPTDTVDYADVVLPAATFLEFNDIVAPYFNPTVSAQVKAVDPPGAALPNQEIARRLALSLGVDDPDLHRSDADLLDAMLAPSGMTFAELAEVGTIWPTPAPVSPFADGFPTRSGRLELAGELFVRRGLNSAPMPEVDAPPPPGQLRLLSPAGPWMMNSTYSNSEQNLRRVGPLEIKLHPTELASRGLIDGAEVRVSSRVGQITAVVRASDDVGPGVALCPKGRWPKLEPSGANVNMVTDAIRTDIGDSSAVHSVHVTVEPMGGSSGPS